jgi:hypothetical protein
MVFGVGLRTKVPTKNRKANIFDTYLIVFDTAA